MPDKNGAGSTGQGADRGQGQRAGQGTCGQGGGQGGNCICPGCGYKVKHTRGQPCNHHFCPQCGISLVRE